MYRICLERSKESIKRILVLSEFFERNKELIDLTKSILPKDSQDNIKELINENMDPDGRSYKNLLRMMMITLYILRVKRVPLL